MELKINMPNELGETLNEIYHEFKKIHPKMGRDEFILTILSKWLEPFKKTVQISFHKDNVRLENNIKQAIKYSGKTQVQVAKELGIDRTYLGRLISGEYDPSVKLALMIVKATGYPMERFEDVFYLEPVEE